MMFPLRMVGVAFAVALAADSPPPGIVEESAGAFAALPQRVGPTPFVQHLATVVPAADLVMGATLLVIVMLVHAVGVRWVTNHAVRRSYRIMARPSSWRADTLMSDTVLLLLAVHLFEIFVWSAALVAAGLVPDWRTAGLVAGNSYTTVGYGKFALPSKWEMVAPIIALSGLLCFGWSASVLVEIVRRCQRIKDAALKAKRLGIPTHTRGKDTVPLPRRRSKPPVALK